MIDRSYGVIPIRYSGSKPQVLLIKNRGGHWSFPKGHREGNETELETARRELREETGIVYCKISEAPIFIERFRVEKDGQTVDREIKFFLGEVVGENIVVDKNEIHEFRWLEFDKALEQITFGETKQLFFMVIKHLEGR